MCANKTHGVSVIEFCKTEDWHRTAFSESTLADPLFEIVYVAREVFADGYISVNVCWRRTDRSVAEKLKKTVTHLTRIIWET